MAGARFSLRDKRLFEISEVEIARVNCSVSHVVKDLRRFPYFDILGLGVASVN